MPLPNIIPTAICFRQLQRLAPLKIGPYLTGSLGPAPLIPFMGAIKIFIITFEADLLYNNRTLKGASYETSTLVAIKPCFSSPTL